MKLQYRLKSLCLAWLAVGIVAAIAAPVVRRSLDGWELVGVQVTPWGVVVLILLLVGSAFGMAYIVRGGK